MEQGTSELGGDAELKLAQFQQLFDNFSKGRTSEHDLVTNNAVPRMNQSIQLEGSSSTIGWEQGVAALAAAATPPHHHRSLSGPGPSHGLHRPSVAWAEGVFARAILPASHSAAAPGSPTLHPRPQRPVPDPQRSIPSLADDGNRIVQPTPLFLPRYALSHSLTSSADQHQIPPDGTSLALQVLRLQNQLTHTQAREDEQEAAQQQQLQHVHEKLAVANEQQRLLQSERWQVLEAMSTAAGSSLQIEKEKRQMESQKNALQFEAAALEEDRRTLGKLSAAVQLEPSLTQAHLQDFQSSAVQLQQSVEPIIAFLQLRTQQRRHPGHHVAATASNSQHQPPALTDEQAAIELLSKLIQTLSQHSATCELPSAGNVSNSWVTSDTRGTMADALSRASFGQPGTQTAAGVQQRPGVRPAARDMALGTLQLQDLLQRALTHLLPLMTKDWQLLSQADVELSTMNAHVAALSEAREQMMGQLNVSLPSLVQRCELLTAENAGLRLDSKALKLRVKEKLGLVAGHNTVLRSQIAAQQAAQDAGDAQRGDLRQQVQTLQREALQDAQALLAGREREQAERAKAETAQLAAEEAGAGLIEAEAQVLQVAEAAAEAQECAADIRVELSKAHTQLAQWQGLHDLKVADMRDAMALQLQTVVSAYSEELAALQGQMIQIEGMPAHTPHNASLGQGLSSGRVEAESVGWRAAYEELLQDADKREGLLESTQKQIENLKIQISNLGALEVTHQQHVERLSLQVQAERQQHATDNRQQAQASATAAAAAAEASTSMQNQLRLEHLQHLQTATLAAAEPQQQLQQQQLAKLHGRQLEQALHSVAAAQARTSEVEAERDVARAQLQALLMQINSQPLLAVNSNTAMPLSLPLPQPTGNRTQPSSSPPLSTHSPSVTYHAQLHNPSERYAQCTESDIQELDNAHQQTVNVLQLIHKASNQGPQHSNTSPSLLSTHELDPTRYSHANARPMSSRPLLQASSSSSSSAGAAIIDTTLATYNTSNGQGVLHAAALAAAICGEGSSGSGVSSGGSADDGGDHIGGSKKGVAVLVRRSNTDISVRSGLSDQDIMQTGSSEIHESSHVSRMGSQASAADLTEELSQSRLQLEAYKAKYARQSVRQASLQQALLDISGDLALGATASLLSTEREPLQRDHPAFGRPPPSQPHSQPQLNAHRLTATPIQLGFQEQGAHQNSTSQQQQRETELNPQQTPTRNFQLDTQQQQLQQLKQQLDDFDLRLANANPQAWVPRTASASQTAPHNSSINAAVATHAVAKHFPLPKEEVSLSRPLPISPTQSPSRNVTSAVILIPQPELDLSTVSTSSYPPPPLYPNSWKAAAEAAVARVSSSGHNSLTATPQRPSSRATSHPPLDHSTSGNSNATHSGILAVQGSSHLVQSNIQAVQVGIHTMHSNNYPVQALVDSAIGALQMLASDAHVHERGPPTEQGNNGRHSQQSTSPHPEHAYTVAGRSYGGWGPGTCSDDGFQTATDAEEGEAGTQQWRDESGRAGDGFAQLEDDDPMSCTDREHEGSTCGNSRDGGEGIARPKSARSRPPSRHQQAGMASQRQLWTANAQNDPQTASHRAGSSESTGSDGSLSHGRVIINNHGNHSNDSSSTHPTRAVLYGPALVVRVQPVTGAASAAGHGHQAQAGGRRLPPSAPGVESRQAWSAQPSASHTSQQQQQAESAAHVSRRGVRETVTAAGRSVPIEVMQRSAAYAGVEGITRPATAQPSDLRRNMHPPAAPSEVIKVARQFMGEEGTTRPITATPSAMQVVRTPPQQLQQPGQHPHRSQQQQRPPPAQQQEQQLSSSGGGGHPSSSSGRPNSSSGGASRPSNGSSDGMDGPPVPLAVMQHAAQFYGLTPATAQHGGSLTLRTQRHPHPHPYHHQTAPDARQSNQHARNAEEEDELDDTEEGAFQQAWAQQQRQQQLQQVHVFQMEAQAPKSVVRRAKQYSGEEGGARPSTASPSSMRPQHGPGAREPEAPDEVLRMARQVTGAEGATDGRPVSAAASSRASNPTTREIPVPRGLLMYIQQYASGQEGDSRPKTASPSVLQPQSTPEVAAPMLVQHMAAQFQAGGEGVTRPTTAPSSDERRSSSATSPHAHPRTSASTSPLQPLNLSVAAAGYRTGLGWPEPQGGPRMSGIVRQALRHFAGEVLGAEMGQERGSSWSWVQYEEEAEGEDEEIGEGGGGGGDEMSADEEEDSGDQMEVAGVESDRLQGRWGEGWEGELVREDSTDNGEGNAHGLAGESHEGESDGEDEEIYLRYNNNHSNGGGGLRAQSPPNHHNLQQEHVLRGASTGSEQPLQGGRPATRGSGGAGGLGNTGGMWQGQGWAEGDGEADEGGYEDDSREEDTSPSVVGSAVEGAEQEVFALVGYSCDEDSDGDSPDDLEVQQMGATPPHDGQRPA